MIHQILLLALFLGLLPLMLFSPVVGALLYQWLDNLPPDQVYLVSLGNLSFMTGALTFLLWLVVEKKIRARLSDVQMQPSVAQRWRSNSAI